MLASAADVDADIDVDEDSDDQVGGRGRGGGRGAEPPVALVWAGEPDLLEDLGVPGRALRRLVEENADDPGAVLADVGERVGFGELLEALR